jgi:hypothetical protein
MEQVFEETYPTMQLLLDDISMMRPAQGFEVQYQMIEQPFNGMSASTTMRETFEDLTLTADVAMIPPHLSMQRVNTYPLEISSEEQPQQLHGASPSQNLQVYRDWAQSALIESFENAST